MSRRLCGACAGHGVVRAHGPRAGLPYRTVEGALAAMAAGRTRDCRPCEASGLALGWPAGSFVLLTGPGGAA